MQNLNLFDKILVVELFNHDYSSHNSARQRGNLIGYELLLTNQIKHTMLAKVPFCVPYFLPQKFNVASWKSQTRNTHNTNPIQSGSEMTPLFFPNQPVGG